MDRKRVFQLVLDRLFEIVTLILAVAAIVFACIQYGDSRKQLSQSQAQLQESHKQLEKLEKITASIQTRYVGSFPENMDDIIDVLKSVGDGGQLNIMTDFAGYGIYSRNSAYQKYLTELVNDRNKKVTIRILVYDQKLAEIVLRTQFKESDFLEEKQRGFRGFFETHPPTPENYEQFLRILLTLQDHAVDTMCDDGIEVRRVPPSQKYLFFLWGNNSPQALFAFRNEATKNRELSFKTVDASLIDVFRTIFDTTWNNVDPVTHPQLSPTCRDLAKPN